MEKEIEGVTVGEVKEPMGGKKRAVGGVLEHRNVSVQEHQLHDIISPALDSRSCWE